MPIDFLSDNNTATQGRDYLASMPENESLSESFGKAIPRMWEDATKAGFNFIKDIPGYVESAKTEAPGALNVLKNHPLHAAGQAGAGLAEFGQSLLNLPKGIADYASNRLNILPKSVAEHVPSIGDQSSNIDSAFGQEQYPGDALLRGLGRNAFNIAGAGKIASAINPLNLTSKSIAKDIIKTSEQNKNIYGEKYKNFFNEAENSGVGNALYDTNIDLATIKKYSPNKSISGIVDFVKNPTLQSAHNAKSDLLKIQRELDKKTTLNSAERKQGKAVKNAIAELQNNMFKYDAGNIHHGLLDKYNQIQQGYSSEVVPYKNKDINAFKRKEISARELINRLSHGEFMAKRGEFHPALKYRKLVKPALIGAGALGVGNKLYSTSMGTPPQNPFSEENMFESGK